MRVRPFIILAVSLATAHNAMGQQHADTVLKGSTIEVIQSYKPQVRKAPKPEWVPQIPPADTSRPILNYDVPQQTLYYTYKSGALRPLALGKDSLMIPYPNYIKAGGGNLSTLYFDAGIGSLKGKNYETSIHLHHLSQKGNIDKQQSAISGLEATGVLHAGSYEWKGRLDVERNQYFFYGMDEHLPVYPSTADLKQTFTTVRVAADMVNKAQFGERKIIYYPTVDASLYNGRFNASETHFGFSVPLYFRLDSALTLVTVASASLNHLKMSDSATGNNLATIMPGIQLEGKVSGRALIGFALGKGGKFNVLPEIVANYKIPSTVLTLSGGWMAGVRQNTYEQLTTENPYLYTTYRKLFSGNGLRQNRRDELFASLAGSQGNHFTYLVKASWLNYTNLATYLDTGVNPKFFNVIYNDVSAISLHAAARYTQATKWSAGVSADFYKYYQGTQAYVWQQPTLNIRGDFSINPIKDLTVSAYVAVLGGMYTINYLGKPVMMTPVTDIGGYAEYRLGGRLNVFLQASNLLNSKYERWNYYQSYGLNVYGGLRLKF
ncbi:hypothetical protein CJD36_017100 [Flavipsychrobacter stenotrophus]|uniref:TonB-dependent receptor-like beta-barrel domain-containing protein n=1 Tax=Flavipsychrobacter stenotrophus TaxID=2077091 RepID=A0A2S7SRW3_9BACT|nr:TonB-dependent receptor [Flavipsychrobacter stenotrophus]PQJ09653.1 hypothetical protein CJD36_017100 [Flavipsychrobacter stenotrophus]